MLCVYIVCLTSSKPIFLTLHKWRTEYTFQFFFLLRMCTEASKITLYYHIAANHFSDCGLTLCPLEKFIDVTKDHIPDNWHAECFGTEKSTVSGTVFSCYIVYFHRFFNDYSKKFCYKCIYLLLYSRSTWEIWIMHWFW